ncbi:MAG: hypothetical protein ACRDSE_00130 [Pseudonocardiaceae bacterium]
MATRTRRGRRRLDRAGVATLTGVSTATVDHWYHHRASTGFPEVAHSDTDGRQWWWKSEVEAFHSVHLAARAATFTRVNRSGEPDDLLTAPQAAKVLGYKNHRSLPDLLLANPDDTQQLPSGRLRRHWYRRTLWDYADARPLRHSTGRPTGSGTGPRKPHPYADDPRLDAALALLTEAGGQPTTGLGAELARRLNIGERTGQRIIHAARHTQP